MAHTLSVEGAHPIRGTVPVSGFKHAVPPLVGLALLADGVSTLENVPDVEDVRVLSRILSDTGADVTHDASRNSLTIHPRGLAKFLIPSHWSSLVHGTLYLLPSILGRMGQVQIGPFGGCAIGAASDGARPLMHICEVMRRFGADVSISDGVVSARVTRFRAARVNMADFARVDSATGKLTGSLYSGATKAAILAAAAAEGTTEIINPYPKPDVLALVAALQAQGVPTQQEADVLRIEGRLNLNGFRQEVLSDLIEVITYICLAAYLDAPVTLTGIRGMVQSGLAPELDCLRRLGVDVVWNGSEAYARRTGALRAVDLVVSSHGVFSDSQPFLALLFCAAQGTSTIREEVWSRRFAYAAGLRQIGADVTVDGSTMTIRSSRPQKAGEVLRATDLRGAATLVLASLGIPGRTIIHGSEHLARGYPDMVGQLKALGAHIGLVSPADSAE